MHTKHTHTKLIIITNNKQITKKGRKYKAKTCRGELVEQSPSPGNVREEAVKGREEDQKQTSCAIILCATHYLSEAYSDTHKKNRREKHEVKMTMGKERGSTRLGVIKG